MSKRYAGAKLWAEGQAEESLRLLDSARGRLEDVEEELTRPGEATSSAVRALDYLEQTVAAVRELILCLQRLALLPTASPEDDDE